MILLLYNYIKPHYINLICSLAGEKYYDSCGTANHGRMNDCQHFLEIIKLSKILRKYYYLLILIKYLYNYNIYLQYLLDFYFFTIKIIIQDTNEIRRGVSCTNWS